MKVGDRNIKVGDTSVKGDQKWAEEKTGSTKQWLQKEQY